MKDESNCVYKANGNPEANQIRAFLKAHDIPCEFKGEALRTTHAFTLNGLGVVQICVPARLVEKARDLLARADAGEFVLEGHAAEESKGIES